jgi:hypothetical protein
MTDNSKRTGATIAHYQFLAWLVPTIEKFPKSHKFTIGDRIEMIALDVLEALIEAHLHQGADAWRRLPSYAAAHESGSDAVDGSSTGTRVPKMWALLKAPTIRRS